MSIQKYFKVEVKLSLYDSTIGRRGFISDGYRPRIFLGFSDPSTNLHYSSDCIIKIQNGDKMYPGETRVVTILILRFEHLEGLLNKYVNIKIKEGPKYVGDGLIVNVIGEE